MYKFNLRRLTKVPLLLIITMIMCVSVQPSGCSLRLLLTTKNDTVMST